MTLKQYLDLRKLTQQQFADRVMLSRAHIGKIISGSRKPSYALKILIRSKTKNSVNINDWETL